MCQRAGNVKPQRKPWAPITDEPAPRRLASKQRCVLRRIDPAYGSYPASRSVSLAENDRSRSPQCLGLICRRQTPNYARLLFAARRSKADLPDSASTCHLGPLCAHPRHSAELGERSEPDIQASAPGGGEGKADTRPASNRSFCRRTSVKASRSGFPRDPGSASHPPASLSDATPPRPRCAAKDRWHLTWPSPARRCFACTGL